MTKLSGILLIFQLLLTVKPLNAQEKALEEFLSDSSMLNSSVSLCILNTSTGEAIFEYNADKSLIPASVLKIVTSSAALELLGPDYRFKTTAGFSGQINRRTGVLNGNIIITGGGDPALGSPYFPGYYKDFMKSWIDSIKSLGIRKIEGRVITDETRYDNQPVPSKWLWEDMGNYYGAGVYGLSVFDNTISIHFQTGEEGSRPVIKGFSPSIGKFNVSNNLTASGNSDKGFIFMSPYSNFGSIEGTIPANLKDFILKGSISDPPLLIAKLLTDMLDSAGIKITGEPTTTRTDDGKIAKETEIISEVISPPLQEIIYVLNHESVNLYAEHLLKELGKVCKDAGTSAAGVEVLYEFIKNSGLCNEGIFLEDGSGMSPFNAINSKILAELLVYMKRDSKNGEEFYRSLPEAGLEGTLKNYFKDQVFNSRLRAKSGSMTRVRSYAGYLKTISGNEMSFAIIINNYSGSPVKIIKGIEDILLETIINR